ncbi:hypothetical protein F5Y18DRAFT_429778 [Xylariaceae sp. FL1019]|nr:hypothetical protein F5Y18DRAFT_429778 [Xylariaceae sp. FL1019]
MAVLNDDEIESKYNNLLKQLETLPPKDKDKEKACELMGLSVNPSEVDIFQAIVCESIHPQSMVHNQDDEDREHAVEETISKITDLCAKKNSLGLDLPVMTRDRRLVEWIRSPTRHRRYSTVEEALEMMQDLDIKERNEQAVTETASRTHTKARERWGRPEFRKALSQRHISLALEPERGSDSNISPKGAELLTDMKRTLTDWADRATEQLGTWSRKLAELYNKEYGTSGGAVYHCTDPAYQAITEHIVDFAVDIEDFNCAIDPLTNEDLRKLMEQTESVRDPMLRNCLQQLREMRP